jgi:hypothetical protein
LPRYFCRKLIDLRKSDGVGDAAPASLKFNQTLNAAAVLGRQNAAPTVRRCNLSGKKLSFGLIKTQEMRA